MTYQAVILKPYQTETQILVSVFTEIDNIYAG